MPGCEARLDRHSAYRDGSPLFACALYIRIVLRERGASSLECLKTDLGPPSSSRLAANLSGVCTSVMDTSRLTHSHWRILDSSLIGTDGPGVRNVEHPHSMREQPALPASPTRKKRFSKAHLDADHYSLAIFKFRSNSLINQVRFRRTSLVKRLTRSRFRGSLSWIIEVTDSPEDVGFYSGLVESTVTGEKRHQRTFKMENTEANRQRRRATCLSSRPLEIFKLPAVDPVPDCWLKIPSRKHRNDQKILSRMFRGYRQCYRKQEGTNVSCFLLPSSSLHCPLYSRQ